MRPYDKTIEMEFWVMFRHWDMLYSPNPARSAAEANSMSQCRKTLDVLERRGDASCSQLGATVRKQNRYLLTSQGVQKVFDKIDESPGWYTVEAGARDLAQRMPMVEQFYRILPKLRAAAGFQAAGDRGLEACEPASPPVHLASKRFLPRHRRIREWGVVRAHLDRGLVHCRGTQTEVG